MKLFYKSIILSFSLFMFTTTLSLATTTPQTIYVPGNYSTIQLAVDAASSGDTIVVAQGTYTEDIKIPTGKDGLELKPASGATVTIVGVATTAANLFPHLEPNIEILSNSVKLHGFIIKSPTYVANFYCSGIVIAARYVEIYGNTFYVWAGAAANFADVSQCIQTHHVATTPGAGVNLTGLNIHDNTFTHLNNNGNYGYEAIYINRDTAGSGEITIKNNTFSGHLFRAITVERSNATISDNIIITDLVPTNNSLSTAGAFEGINIRDSGAGGPVAESNISVTNNTIKGSTTGKGFLHGARFGKTGQTLSSITVSNNTISNNAIGVYVHASANGVVVNTNNIFGNTTPFESTNYGVQNNDSANTLNATNNWWGTDAGPGSAISDHVNATPWTTKSQGADSDNVPATTEAAAPNNGDANGDGTPDNQQDNVASLLIASGGNYVCVDSTVSGHPETVIPLEAVHSITKSSLPPDSENVSMSLDLVGFRVPITAGGTTTIKLTFYLNHPLASTDGLVYRKYGDTPPYDGIPEWYNMDSDKVTFSQTVIDNKPVLVVTLTLTDGMKGDDTGVDGIIVDDGGPGGSISFIPTLNEWGLIILTILLVGASFVFLKKNQGNLNMPIPH